MLSWIGGVAIFVVAGLFRVVPIPSGLPYTDYVDEGHVLHQTIDAFNNRSLDVYWYGLPALPAYCAGAGMVLYGPIYRHFHGHRFQEDLPNEPDLPSSKVNYDFIAPVELIVSGRIATACLSLAAVILSGVFAAQIATRRVGLLAMLLVAVCPALVSRGSIVIVDTFATFFVLVVLYLCARIRVQAAQPVWRVVALAGIATGLAFASKYPAASVGLAVIVTLMLLPVPWRRRLQLLVPAAGGLLFGTLIGAPMIFVKPMAVWNDIVGNVRAYAEIQSAEGYFAQAISMSELGVALLLFGLAGVIVMLRQEKTRAVALGWICFAVLLIAAYWGKSFRPLRSFLPLIPLLCIAAALAFSVLIDWAQREAGQWWRLGLTAALIGGCVVVLGFSSFRQVRSRMVHRDSRIQAIDWLQEHATKGEKVLGLRELAILPDEWKRIAASPTVVSWLEASALLEREQFDYLVTGEFDLRYAPDPERSSAYLTSWKEKTAPLPVGASFGSVVTQVVPYVWRTNDERILILRKRANDL